MGGSHLSLRRRARHILRKWAGTVLCATAQLHLIHGVENYYSARGCSRGTSARRVSVGMTTNREEVRAATGDDDDLGEARSLNSDVFKAATKRMRSTDPCWRTRLLTRTPLQVSPRVVMAGLEGLVTRPGHEAGGVVEYWSRRGCGHVPRPLDSCTRNETVRNWSQDGDDAVNSLTQHHVVIRDREHTSRYCRKYKTGVNVRHQQYKNNSCETTGRKKSHWLFHSVWMIDERSCIGDTTVRQYN